MVEGNKNIWGREVMPRAPSLGLLCCPRIEEGEAARLENAYCFLNKQLTTLLRGEHDAGRQSTGQHQIGQIDKAAP